MSMWRRSRSWILQLVIFLLIWWAIQWIHSLKLLDGGVRGPDFVLSSAAGPEVASESLLGRPTLIYFFAPWCGICHFSIDKVEQLKQDHPELNVIAIALDYSARSEVIAFIAKHDLTIPVLLGNRQVAEAYKITAFPTYYTLDRRGRVVAKDTGVSTGIGVAIRAWLAQ